MVLFTHHDVASTGSVVSIFQGTHLCLGFVSEVQFHSLYAHVTAPWEQKRGVKTAQKLSRPEVSGRARRKHVWSPTSERPLSQSSILLVKYHHDSSPLPSWPPLLAAAWRAAGLCQSSMSPLIRTRSHSCAAPAPCLLVFVWCERAATDGRETDGTWGTDLDKKLQVSVVIE